MSRDDAASQIIEQVKALIAAIQYDDSGFNGQGGNGGLLSPETRQAADKAGLMIDAWDRWWKDGNSVVRQVSTNTPPALTGGRGAWSYTVAVTIDGQPYEVKVPIGDGRYHAERMFELIVGPLIAPRPLDPAPVDFRHYGGDTPKLAER